MLLCDDQYLACVLEIRFNTFRHEIRRSYIDDKTIETKQKPLNKRCRPYRHDGFLDWYNNIILYKIMIII